MVPLKHRRVPCQRDYAMVQKRMHGSVPHVYIEVVAVDASRKDPGPVRDWGAASNGLDNAQRAIDKT
jgi:hypothetical protein